MATAALLRRRETAVLLRSLRCREFSFAPDFRTLPWIMKPGTDKTPLQQVGRSCKLAMQLMPAYSEGDRIRKDGRECDLWKAGWDSSWHCNVIGVDLGTTNSYVAVMEGKNPKVIKIPSVFAFSEEGKPLVGTLAKQQAIRNPTSSFFGSKRLIGRHFDDPHIQQLMKMFPYKIARAPRGAAWVEVDGQQYSPIEISAFILIKMKKLAEAYLGKSVNEAVVTVPAYFNNTQRRATEYAGRIAGLDVLRIINEPIAAAFSYGMNNKQGIFAVFDLGGGIFDISILETASNGGFKLKATNGDACLGGEDFDNALLEFFVSEFKRTEGIDLSEDGVALQRLREAGEKAKIRLSSTYQTEINLPFIRGAKHFNITLTRSKFEALVNHLIERIKAVCQACLEGGGISINEIDEVILVGGMTRLPKVQEVVSEIFGKSPSKVVNPDNAVALGAAIQERVYRHDIREALGLNY